MTNMQHSLATSEFKMESVLVVKQNLCINVRFSSK